MQSELILLRPEIDSPTSLRSAANVDAVERLMRALASGDRLDRGGVMVQEHLATGGKRLRARLVLTATAALGGQRGDAVGWAAAVELLHNATLIHDDIQDGDRMRRGEPTTWVRHGAAQAINAGDLMLMLPFMALRHGELAAAVRWLLSEALSQQAIQIVRGQVEDLDMLSSESFSWSSYLRVVRNKTGGLFSLPIQGAALITGHSPEQALRLAEAFLPLGSLFQMQDDVLDLYGDKGRELPGADLREGKVSALVVAHLSRVPEDRHWLTALLRTDRDATSQVDVERAIRRFRDSGALSDTLAHIQQLAETVHRSPVLAEVPLLHAVARQLAGLAVAPIRHLWTS
jgi:geranylgeranyl diphosphate synthase type I